MTVDKFLALAFCRGFLFSLSGFLKETSPAVSIIEVGKNSYGHPTKRVLNGLASVGSQVYRTDQDGIVKVGVDKK